MCHEASLALREHTMLNLRARLHAQSEAMPTALGPMCFAFLNPLKAEEKSTSVKPFEFPRSNHGFACCSCFSVLANGWYVSSSFHRRRCCSHGHRRRCRRCHVMLLLMSLSSLSSMSCCLVFSWRCCCFCCVYCFVDVSDG